MTKRKIPRVAAQPVNYVAVVLDRSGSMGPLRAETVEAFNTVLITLQEQALNWGQRTYLTVVVFSDYAEVLQYLVPVEKVSPLSPGAYQPEGWTALLDGVALGVAQLQLAESPTKNTSYLVVTLTDGEENRSTRCSPAQFLSQLTELQATGTWSFTFQVPRGSAARLAERYGVPRHNITEWEQSARGLLATTQVTTSGLQGFFSARAGGQQATRQFYVPATSSLTAAPQKVAAQLHDLSAGFKVLTVATESVVKPFVEARLKRPYLVGQAYYQLMKPERVQPHKAVLVMEKGSKTVWGGEEARGLIGLPEGQNARVTPGNHSSYDIFVQSTSTNRRLPRGTRVLVDLRQTQALAPTWGRP